MNIKSLAANILAFPIRAKKTERKMEASTDRDANPDFQKGNQNPQRHMTQEELNQVLENLRNLKGVKENGLVVRLATENDVVRVFVEDSTGKVVRRIAEQDLWPLLKLKESAKGNILDRAL